MNYEFETPDPIDLDVELGDGSVDVRADATGRTSVQVIGPRSEAFRVVQDGRHIRIAPPRDHSWRFGTHRVRVVIPELSDLSIGCGSASIEVAGAVGRADLSSGSGAVTCERAEMLAVSTGSGAIGATSVGVLHAKSGSGDLDVGEVREEAQVTSGAGRIRIGRLVGAITAKTGSGWLRIDHLIGDLRFSTGSGAVGIIRVSRGRLDIAASSGKVRVGIDPGVPVWTDITSVSGRVESNLQPVGEPQPGQDHVELRVHTVSGSIRLDPADPGQDAVTTAPVQDAVVMPHF